MNSKFLLGNVVSEAIRIAPGVSKAVFAGSVDHSRKLAAAFKRRGVVAVHLDAETSPKEREAMLIALGKGEIEAICNYDVLSEGWDLPDLGAVILARPFRSRTKYLQVVGRGMRWRRGPRPIVLDHGNNAPRFGLWPGDDVEWAVEAVRGLLREDPRRGDVVPRVRSSETCVTVWPLRSKLAGITRPRKSSIRPCRASAPSCRQPSKV